MQILRAKDYHRKDIEWIYDAFPYPEVILAYKNTEDLIIKNSITDPIELIFTMAKAENLQLKWTNKLYNQVFSNPEIDNIEKIDIVFNLLKVTVDETYIINNMIYYVYRYIFDCLFKTFVDRGLLFERKVPLWWPKERIEKEIDLMIEKESVNYVRSAELPIHCYFIDNNIDLLKESQKLDHCAYERWDEAKNRNSFFIAMRLPERATFEIAKDLYMNDFRIIEAAGYDNCRPNNEAIDIIASWLKIDSTQEFFIKNTFNRYE